MFVEEFCFIQLICLERKSHVYLDKVFPPYTPSSFFQLLYFTVCINVNPEMAGLSELLFSHTSTHCQIPPPKKLMLSLWQHFFSLGRNSNTVRRLTISSLWHLPTWVGSKPHFQEIQLWKLCSAQRHTSKPDCYLALIYLPWFSASLDHLPAVELHYIQPWCLPLWVVDHRNVFVPG